ncbi:hypothetical protein GGX14DRAFT_664794 [Mycena pura]|uniref:CBM1 domain-containing protein n=1 Tax=Mycena pura TaxID=153505 RepID=A0AAD6V0M3_9AGAR|nr:hypothetical protein GGX14DRAFT_664794 [Mycena pura]
MFSAFLALLVILPSLINAQGAAFSQCGGQGWLGPTTCVAGATCTVLNPFFSQCLPSGVGGTTTTISATSTGAGGTTTTTSATSSSTFAPTYSVVPIPTTGTGTGTGDPAPTGTSTPGANPVTLVNFSHTCQSIDFSGDILKASCKDWGGSFKTTSIDTNGCIGNNNGVLVAGSNYIQSCSGITFNPGTITINVTCTDRNKQQVPASLNLVCIVKSFSMRYRFIRTTQTSISEFATTTRCLQLPELVELIIYVPIMCSHLDVPYHPEIFLDRQPEQGPRRARQDLYSFLQSCTQIALEEPLRPSRASDWERVLVYAPHVKHIVTNSVDLSPIFLEVSRWLPKNMLPNLQGLHWTQQENNFQYIDHFLSSQLTTIRILDPSFDALGLSALKPQVVSAVSTCVLGLHGIETLITDAVDQPTLEHLSLLSSVRHLSLGDVPPNLSALPCDKALFPSLQKLCFNSDSETPPASGSSDDAVHRLFSAASRGISHSTLMEFEFSNDFDAFDPWDSASYLIRPQSFCSLFCFVNLASVSVSSAVGIDLDDSTVTDMARSWPRIECLKLQSYYCNTAPRATLQCLEAFPKYCPHLTTLYLPFDATVVVVVLHGTVPLRNAGFQELSRCTKH